MFILSFISLALEDASVKILLHGISEILLPMFSCWTFMMSRLMFKSFIKVQFILAYNVSWWSSFTLFHVPFQISICWRGYFYPILCFCPLCQILIDYRDMGLFLDFLFCSIDLCVSSYASSSPFWLQWICNIVWYQVWWLLLLCSLSRLLRLFRIFFVRSI